MFTVKESNNLFIVLDMRQNSSYQNPLLCCRACLATDCRLFDIHEYKLADAFYHISGTPGIPDKLPQYLCSYCRTLLLKCASFRDMCIQTQQHLTRELNADCFTQINKQYHEYFNLSVTEVETIDVAPLAGDINAVDNAPATYINVEPTINIVDVNSIIEQTKKTTEHEITKDNVSNDKAVKVENDIKRKITIRTIIGQKQKINKDATETKLNIKKESACDNFDLVNNSPIESKSNMDVDNEDENEDIISQNKSSFSDNKYIINNIISKENGNCSVEKLQENTEETKNNVFKKSKKTAKRGLSNQNIDVEEISLNKLMKEKKDVREKIDETMKNKAFENDYLVKIDILSKEEQLAEIAARKQTRNYLESRFKCEDCCKGFDMDAAFENHMLRHSPSAGAFPCEICRTRFPKNFKRTSHEKRHQLMFTCTECNFVSRNKNQARLHHGVHAGKTYECRLCGKTFLKQSSYLSHVRVAHPAANMACDLCGEGFVGPKGLKLHKARMHSKNIKCTICSAKFLSVAAVTVHTDTAGEHAGLRPCEQCGENCASEAALQAHVAETHPTETSRCEECDLSFPSTTAYKIHVSRKHLEQRKNEGSLRSLRKPPLPGAYMCEECGQILQCRGRLLVHQRSHRGLKPFSCSECSKCFLTKEALKNHFRRHTGEKPFQCPRCPLAFAQKCQFMRHHKTVHLGLRGCFPCPICGSTVTTKGSLRVHIDAKHGGKGWPKSRKRGNKTKPAENK